MLHHKDESMYKDLRFWLALFFFGALLSFLILTYPS